MSADHRARAYLAQLLEQAPPLSQEQRDRLATLLHSGQSRSRTTARVGGDHARRNVA